MQKNDSGPNGKPVLQVSDLVVKFGEHTAVNGVHLTIQPGELRALIGGNGAGKSTTLNAIAGNVKPAGGTILLNGEDITSLPPHVTAKRGIARTFQLPNVLPGLTVEENVWLGINAKAKIPWHPWKKASGAKEMLSKARAYCEMVNLQDKWSELSGNLSHGDQKLLEIAVALSLEGSILLLDEPTQGVSPHEIETFMELVVRVAKEKTVLMIEHNMDVVLEIANRVTVLHHGQVIAEDIPSAVIKNDRVREVYLGA